MPNGYAPCRAAPMTEGSSPIHRRAVLLGAAALASMPGAALTSPALRTWRGTAMGAGARITLAHPDADTLIARARAEIDRLEDIFSLYRAGSALSRLNRAGELIAPPFELLECLSLCARVHTASGGRFDPSIQPLWSLYAETHSAGNTPTRAQIDAALARVGWNGVRYDSGAVRLRPGMALTLNGVAQGYAADRVAALLRDAGVEQALIDTGEIRAMDAPEGRDGWPVTVKDGPEITLGNRGLATSSPLGTVFDTGGAVGHILSPQTGLPVTARWRTISISAPRAAVADALSTAGAMMPDQASLDALIAKFRGARIEAAQAA